MNRWFPFIAALFVVLMATAGAHDAWSQFSIKEVALDGSDIPGAPEIDNASNRLNFDTVCIPGLRVKRISIRNTGSQTASATPTIASLLELAAKAPTWALLREDGTGFSNPLLQIPPLLTNIPAGGRRDFQIRYAPTTASPTPNDVISIELSTSPARTLGGVGAGVSPLLVLVSPASPIAFPTTPVGAQSAPQNITLRSTGKCPITVSDVVVRAPDGTPNPNYVVVAKPPSGTVISTGVLSVQVVFRPVVPCAPEGRLVVLNGNGQSAAVSIVLQGTSTGSRVTFSPWDDVSLRGYVQPYIVSWYLPFATPGSFEIINRPAPGGDPSCLAATTIRDIRITLNSAEFALAPSTPARPFTLGANSSQTIQVDFTPIATSTAETRTGELSVTYDNNGVETTVYIDLIAQINEGKLEFRRPPATVISSIDFGKVRLGTVSAPQTVVIANTGTLKIDIGNAAQNSDTVLYRPPFLVPTGGQLPNAVRLDEAGGNNSTASFQARFAPQAADFGPQQGHYLVEVVQGSRFKRKPYDTLYATGTGATPNFTRALDTVLVGQASVNTTVTRSVKEFWSNRPGRGIALAHLSSVDIESVQMTSLQPATAASEFTLTRTGAFSLEDNGTYDETFSFRPTISTPLVHLALVRVVYDSVGNDNKEMFFVLRGDVRAPEVSALEQTIDFGEVVVGTTGTAVSPAVLLTNTGTAVLQFFSPVLADPATPKVFSLVPAEFPMSVPIGGAMTPSGLRFTPDAEGEYTATLTLTTNTGGAHSTIVFTLKGKGILPGIQSNSTELNFGRVRIGRTAVDTLRLRNTAPKTQLTISGFVLSSPEFAVEAVPPLDLGTAYQPIPVTFTPQRPTGMRLDSMLIDNTSPRRPSILLRAEAALGRMQAFASGGTTAIDRVEFGNVFVQQQQSRELDLRNTGTFAYALTRLELTGDNAGDFSLSASSPGVLLVSGYPDDFAVDIDAAVSQTVSFFPTGAGDKHAVLRIIGFDPVSGLAEDTTVVELYGIGSDLAITGDNGDTLDFGAVLVGTTAVRDGVGDRFIRLANPSQNTVTIASVVVQGAPQFSTTGRSIALPPGSSDTVRVYFSPDAASVQPVTAAVVLTYAGGFERTVPVSGRGVAPSARIDGVVYTADPTEKTLAMTADINTTTTAVVTLANDGAYPLVISDLHWEQDVAPWMTVDALPGFTPLTLAPGAHRDVLFTFAPTAQDIRTARLVFTSNHVAMDAASDSSSFAIVITAEGIYSEPPLVVQTVLPVLSGAPGDRITVPIVLRSTDMQTAGISRFVPVLRYDPTLLVPRSVSTGAAAAGFGAVLTETTPGRVEVAIEGGTALGEGTIAEVSFDVLLGSAVSSPLLLDVAGSTVASAVPVALASSDGMVVLSEFCAADRRLVGMENGPLLALAERPDGAFLHLAVGLPTDDPATVTVYDAYGRTLATPVNGSLPAGISTVRVDTRSFAGGVYFVVLRSGTIVRTLRVVVAR